MKKIALLLLLVPFFGFAQYYEGTIKFTNGNTLKGLIEFPAIMNQAVFYKSSEEDKIEKYSVNKIDQIEIYFKEDNKTLTYVSTLYYDTSMTGKLKGLSEGKIWLELIYDGKLKIYKTIGRSSMNISANNPPSTFITYYFKIPNAKYPQKIYREEKGSFASGQFNLIKIFLGRYLKEDCPTLVDLLERKEFKEKGFASIGELYDQNCGK